MASARNSPAADRKASFKVPPASVRDATSSQEYRRKKALEEQKRRRAERFDSSRQLDFFADLSLGPSDNEDEAEEPQAAREGISNFASMLAPAPAPSVIDHSATTDITIHTEADGPAQPSGAQSSGKKKGKNKRKGKGRSKAKGSPPKPSKWADKCMYAELLEMNEEPGSMQGDGIPDDLETGWVTVAPIPVGKRCLAVTHAPSGVAGFVPNTVLRSRVLGKQLMKPFPSPLPPHTVLDCILDENWQTNGILHVLDVLTWKGQDIGDCETAFRFWWRDMRLSELSSYPPSVQPLDSDSKENAQTGYKFAYPTTFRPIPHHVNASLLDFLTKIIPLTRQITYHQVQIPAETSSSGDMDLDGQEPAAANLESVTVPLKSDGLLLYVAQATYEPGTSPLSSWVPIRAYTEWKDQDQQGVASQQPEAPLDKFERLIRKRLEGNAQAPEVNME
ncbi:hypothetical protein K474DRAFT_1661558 [Panus rudis PR-1116 ss-1]|nr:hypothetical protein K474DRAFT_1661558 [Panus rudis PR-1116 ss-1]